MPKPQKPSDLRSSSSFVSFASLVVVVGLSVSLGLARDVWGGPPPSDETPTEADETSPEQAAADPGSPPESEDPTEAQTLPDATDLPPEGAPAEEPVLDEATTVPAAGSLRAQMEDGMAELGELAVEARADEDLVRAACVLDKQDRANDVMDLGTSELLIIRDAATPDQTRSFALEKLDAAAGRIDKLVEEAKECAGRQGPEEDANITRNESDEPRTVPMWNPTTGLGDPPVPPPIDGGWPPAASPIE